MKYFRLICVFVWSCLGSKLSGGDPSCPNIPVKKDLDFQFVQDRTEGCYEQLPGVMVAGLRLLNSKFFGTTRWSAYSYKDKPIKELGPKTSRSWHGELSFTDDDDKFSALIVQDWGGNSHFKCGGGGDAKNSPTDAMFEGARREKWRTGDDVLRVMVVAAYSPWHEPLPNPSDYGLVPHPNIETALGGSIYNYVPPEHLGQIFAEKDIVPIIIAKKANVGYYEDLMSQIGVERSCVGTVSEGHSVNFYEVMVECMEKALCVQGSTTTSTTTVTSTTTATSTTTVTTTPVATTTTLATTTTTPSATTTTPAETTASGIPEVPVLPQDGVPEVPVLPQEDSPVAPQQPQAPCPCQQQPQVPCGCQQPAVPVVPVYPVVYPMMMTY